MSAPRTGPQSELRIQGRRVELPVEVRDASSGTAVFRVDAEAARRLLPGPGLEVAEIWPGQALLSLAMVDYRDNDLGDYDEISLALFVREQGAPRGLPLLGTLRDLLRSRLPTYIHRLPVNQSFTCEAGRSVWGFPKTLDRIEIERAAGRARCRWHSGGRPVLAFSVPARGARKMPDAVLQTYTWLDGALHRTAFVSGARGVGFALGGAELELGDHPIADELKALGLPRKALFSAWMEHLHGRFEAPQKL